MTLQPGARLGPYEIQSAIGAGGMGEVYKARDARLDRTVAIKVLPGHVASDPDLRQRFEREARAVAALNHPHICTLHDIGQQDGVDFLVMEYLEGQTLAERLEKGALPLDQALRYAIEIADALDKAHRAGITHRDLKPGNIMLTKSGAKLLDFGLAKLRQDAAPAAVPLSALPTAQDPITAQGTILGTLQYMAPEQLEAKETDARTDIFALGAVVYEMVTGKKAFEGKTHASLIAAILGREPPPVSSIQPLTPLALDRVVKKCLAKEPEKRWQSANDLTDELKWIAEADNAGVTAKPAARHGSRARVAWILVTACLTLALAASLLMRQPPAPPATDDLARFPLSPPEQGRFEGTLAANAALAVAVAPDGRHVAFPATSAGQQSHLLWIRGLDVLAPQPLAATVNGDAPFWSPDARFLGFFADGKLKKIAVAGGPAQMLADAPNGRGGTWSGEEVIVFAPSPADGLYRLPAAGGKPVPVTHLDAARGETSHQWPQFLPDHRHFLYYADSSQPEQQGIRLGTLDGLETRQLVQADSQAMYAPPGYLLFVRAGTLLAQPFDARRFELRGEPVPVAEQVTMSGSSVMRNASFSISPSGVLVYGQGSARPISQLQWKDRSGKTLGSPVPPAEYNSVALSPDGQRVAFTMVQNQNLDVWVLDLARGTSSRLTFDPAADRLPLWSPDGARIAFRNDRDFGLYQRAATGTGQAELLLKLSSSGINPLPTDWSTDGQNIVYSVVGQTGSRDLWVLALTPERQASPYLQGPFNEDQGRFAPDGRWVAYISDESGRYEVYVQPFPATGGKWQISRDGGTQPVWRPNGRELFYLAPDGTLMAVPVTGGGAFEAGTPVPLFKTAISQPTGIRNQYAVSTDGQRFLIITPTHEMSSPPLTVVLNWAAALKK